MVQVQQCFRWCDDFIWFYGFVVATGVWAVLAMCDPVIEVFWDQHHSVGNILEQYLFRMSCGLQGGIAGFAIMFSENCINYKCNFMRIWIIQANCTSGRLFGTNGGTGGIVYTQADGGIVKALSQGVYLARNLIFAGDEFCFFGLKIFHVWWKCTCDGAAGLLVNCIGLTLCHFNVGTVYYCFAIYKSATGVFVNAIDVYVCDFVGQCFCVNLAGYAVIVIFALICCWYGFQVIYDAGTIQDIFYRW